MVTSYVCYQKVFICFVNTHSPPTFSSSSPMPFCKSYRHLQVRKAYVNGNINKWFAFTWFKYWITFAIKVVVVRLFSGVIIHTETKMSCNYCFSFVVCQMFKLIPLRIIENLSKQSHKTDSKGLRG